MKRRRMRADVQAETRETGIDGRIPRHTLAQRTLEFLALFPAVKHPRCFPSPVSETRETGIDWP